MGNFLSEEQKDMAIEKLEDIIWENRGLWIHHGHVREVFRSCNVSSQSTKKEIEKYFVAKEKEHEEKGIAFEKNGATAMHSHHMSLSRRYGKVSRLIYFLMNEM
jgi:hypothetical protein